MFMSQQITQVVIYEQEYSFGGTVAKGSCSSAANAWNKEVSITEGYDYKPDMCIQVTFANGNTVGASTPQIIYSSDQQTYYSDQSMTEQITLVSIWNRKITYTGTGSAYEYVTFPTVTINNVTKPLCDSRGHTAGTGCYNAGDKIVLRDDGEAYLIQNSDVRESTSEYVIYSDGLTRSL